MTDFNEYYAVEYFGFGFFIRYVFRHSGRNITVVIVWVYLNWRFHTFALIQQPSLVSVAKNKTKQLNTSKLCRQNPPKINCFRKSATRILAWDDYINMRKGNSKHIVGVYLRVRVYVRACGLFGNFMTPRIQISIDMKHKRKNTHVQRMALYSK